MKKVLKDIEKSVSLISSITSSYEIMMHKLSEVSSQHSLLVNRIKALYLSETLLSGDCSFTYPSEGLREALPLITSVINKTVKAQSKHKIGSAQFKRLQHIIQAIITSKSHIENEMMSEARHE